MASGAPADLILQPSTVALYQRAGHKPVLFLWGETVLLPDPADCFSPHVGTQESLNIWMVPT